jgi:S-adenosylmethionine decarboxylase
MGVAAPHNSLICRYSMNGMLRDTFMTIHVTPEPGFSYASCELHGLQGDRSDVADMVCKVASIFKPGHLVISHTAHDQPFADAAATFAAEGYTVESVSSQELVTGGTVTFAALRRSGEMASCGSSLSESGQFSPTSIGRASE